MHATLSGAAASPERRLALHYAVQFGAVGLAAPYLALWLDARGVSAAMIGAIIAAPSLAMLATTVAIGRRIDALAEPRHGIVVLNALVLGLNAALSLAGEAWAVLVVWTLGGVLMHAMVPATDALALGVTRRRGSDWARLRVFGSLGFVLAMVGGGVLYERVGIGVFLWALVGSSLARLLTALALPDARAPAVGAPPASAAAPPRPHPAAASGVPRAEPPAASAHAVGADSGAALDGDAVPASGEGGGELYRPGVLLTLAGAALINASHALFYGFGLLIWTRAGIGETLGGVLWSTGVVAEMVLMWRFREIARRLSARGCLLVAGVAGVARWTVAATEPPLALWFAAQTLHALTFGLMFVATASFIARRVGEEHAARGQSLSATLAAGTMALAASGAGLAYELVGTAAYVPMAALALGGTLLVAASYRTGLD